MSKISADIKEGLGLVQVYTGNGKGKTTAALGLAFRAAGRGLNVIMVQFMKPPENYGEHIAAERFDNFTILPLGLDHMKQRVDKEDDISVSQKTLEKAKELIYSDEYDLVIMDECNVAMSRHLIDVDEVIDMLRNRPENIEIVLTGRKAPQKIIDYADLVTEMKMIKHPFDKGISARKGIEY